MLQDVACSLAGPLHHVADAGLPGQEALSGAALPSSSSLLQQRKGPGRATGSLSMWAGTDSHIPLACTRQNRCSLNPALSPLQRKSLLGQGDPISTRTAPLDAVQQRMALPLLQVLPLVSPTDPVISLASFISVQLRNSSFQEACLSLGLKYRILQLGDEREQHYHLNRQVCDIFILEMMFQVVKWAFPF